MTFLTALWCLLTIPFFCQWCCSRCNSLERILLVYCVALRFTLFTVAHVHLFLLLMPLSDLHSNLHFGRSGKKHYLCQAISAKLPSTMFFVHFSLGNSPSITSSCQPSSSYLQTQLTGSCCSAETGVIC